MALASYLHVRQAVLDGILVLVALALVGWVVFVLWMRSYNGEVAFECLHAPTCLSQALQNAQQGPIHAGPPGK